jgi:hypothetical protein
MYDGLGYFVLITGMFVYLFAKKSVFAKLNPTVSDEYF